LDGPERAVEWDRAEVKAEDVTGKLQVVIIEAESLKTISARR